ncbi:helix-turn-helix transcriptional regulator [Janibacter alittae]|uniref:Helix-turn-helix transcriptional regulator n=1 Tax=Janibacter alittae TaxID=3115209 RepID=A0ABZ2MHR4_9MICO
MPESEEEELLDELVRGWVEVYKKSATTLVLLRLIAEAVEADTSTIAETLAQRTGWEHTERGLYRALRRLRGLGLLSVREQPGHRTGAQRHLYGLTDRGAGYLHRIESALID